MVQNLITGLGLSIVKKMMETMNGRVWCECEPGKGATFVVEVPAVLNSSNEAESSESGTKFEPSHLESRPGDHGSFYDDDFNASLMKRLCSHPIRVPRLACVIGIVALLGCQSPGPQLRSKADLDIYSRLSAEEREAVDAGVLRKGMTPETVQLAWGRPTGKRTLVDQGKPQTEWSYYRTRWVDQPTWDYTYLDRYGRPMMDFRMKRVGIPFLRARAVFENGHLVDWEETLP